MGDETAELERLRARAYGRDADIAVDPAALARLRYLEGAQAGAVVTAPPKPPSPVEAPPVGGVIDEVPGASERAAAAVESTDDPAPSASAAGEFRAEVFERAASTPLWRRRGVLVAAAAVAGMLVGALGMQVFAPAPAVSVETGAVLADTVRADPSLEWPAIFGPSDDEHRVWSYRGLTIMTSTALRYIGSANSESDCLMALESAALEPYLGPDADDGSSGYSIDGMQLTGCAAGAFPATLQFIVDQNAPSALRARFADGTAVQIVLQGDDLRVFEHTG
ncbi:hypothetical protein [Microbacterium dauci]|uniref:Uncharacterized protein n=1 Tax=Microbacterium dauci TaxID=3048008 RepID=A0ABT6ZBG6_9MICO|nr:hypothetical protein [Microbacterium sp. LX3-4]MDJ1113341.1 hypothetical protein [Microbacterium sp. LX3-4]